MIKQDPDKLDNRALRVKDSTSAVSAAGSVL